MQIEAIDCAKAAEDLLSKARLPTSDLPQAGETGNLQLFGIHDKDRLIGMVGIEHYGSVGLLRSLAVSEDYQRRGHGRALVEHAEAWAFQKGIKALYLLTISAGDFFNRRGYKVLSRLEAPLAITNTKQFLGLCPDSSTFMGKVLHR
jgi:amino-acid N-acetyltransferase